MARPRVTFSNPPVTIKNNSADSKTLHLYASQTDYTLPADTFLDVSSGLGGTVIEGALSGTGIFQVYADKDNNPLGLTDFTDGPQDALFNGTTFKTGTASGLFDRTDGSPFSLTGVVTATISGGGAGQFSSSIAATPPTAVPEPGTLLLLGTGLAGAGAWRGKRWFGRKSA